MYIVWMGLKYLVDQMEFEKRSEFQMAEEIRDMVK